VTLTNPKPLGYAYGEALPSGEVNSVWSQLPNAVDGIGGGAYTLTAPLSIDGDTVTIDDLEVTTGAVVNGALSVVGSSFLAAVAATSVATGALDVTGNTTLGNAGTDLVTLAGVLGFTGTGRVKTSGTVHPNANTAVDVAASRWNSAAPSGSAKSYTLSCTNEGNGDWFAFYNDNGSENVLLAGLVVGVVTPNRGHFYLRIAGSWTFMFAWISA
jgi:hypothetical protein